ncbi:cobalt ABC transporter permease [Clostridium thermobutyricum]|uniref:cobalt ABC transporter permease n=1 Tax=Clostridium thermobutyricum TaxID=29372 RepID=UPI0018A9E0A2|nr:cobalt ABC transporter permease [Clostridium thermobutyricum]
MNIQDTLINQIGPVVIAAVIGILGVTIKAVGNVIIELIQKKKEEVEQKLEIGKHQQELETAREVWGMIDEQYRITGKVEDLIKSKANDFDKLLLAKIPYLTIDEVQDLRQAIAGEVNKGKKLLNEDSFKTQLVDIQNKNNKLVQENSELKAKLNQVKSVLPIEQSQ